MTPSAQGGAAAIDDVTVEEKLLQDGEIIVLSIKPSGWFVLQISSPVWVLAVLVAAAVAGAQSLGVMSVGHRLTYLLLAAVATLRLVVACVQWVGIRYVLTNHRLLRLRTLATTTIYELPLKIVHEAAASASAPQRLLGVGDVVFLDERSRPFEGVWVCVAGPADVAETVNQTLRQYRL
ncbi:hypothetical protein LCGC14_0125200 [marine sediment metagenome]|uniref:DUF304 domain-containing protein n=1 Tax=marine sediment metagenome TaxID=412755 RepID=A0A0F9V668_9ZZZZ|nr:hypothetical protein [Phycisphaerae bacterium]HDZ44283.1 hypothetical protein [Phycisphaerae bacterium]